jgi:hypothetical protein
MQQRPGDTMSDHDAGLAQAGTPPPGPVGSPGSSDSRLEMAYDAIQKNLESQDATFANLRNRATGLFTAAAVVTTFGTAVGLITNDPSKGRVLPANAAVAALVIVVVIGVAVMYVQRPVYRWTFGPSGAKILELADRGESQDSIRRMYVGALAKKIVINAKIIKHRAYAYELGIFLLAIEVVILVLNMT